ncbi:MAG: DegQ family serine endoprotease [Parvibaculum sp.]|uniref:DegQ family serine endoprotease n=1 Tax=Parvibaculum sp. TaxID=2024848 RepID=UPI0025E52FA5|nr:DegQ family serine endoprotease [Parvibaculum sp.]MCE9649005.1 DegQ family serine endoprotease [Parvibaculum sp.]
MVVEFMTNTSPFAGWLAMVAGAAMLTGALAFFPWSAQADTTRVLPNDSSDVTLSYSSVVKRVAPAVVNVYSKRVVQAQSASPFLNDPFFQRFFGDRFSFGMPRERVQQSLGSGVIVDAGGLIVTNYHVIKGGEMFRVALADRREFEAKVVLADERTDLAVLKIDTKGEKLPFLQFKDSDTVEVGDLVLAIGNPFGVGQTVTTGIVSALARTHVGVSDYQFFIQTDAAINPGNSGGALVTTDGKVIGINSAIYSQTGGSVGIGFAIPSNMVKLVVDSARHGGHIKRPWIGAGLQAVDAQLAGTLGLDRPGGALVRDVYKGGPAARAGLAEGDVIRSVDGNDTDDPEAVRYRFATKALGGKVKLRYLRNGQTLETQMALESPPETPPAEKTLIKGRNPFAGATVANLSPAVADEIGLDALGSEGVVILKIEDGSTADQIQFQPGDIVVAVGKDKIGSVKALKAAVAGTRPQWDFAIKRGDRTFTASVGG